MILRNFDKFQSKNIDNGPMIIREGKQMIIKSYDDRTIPFLQPTSKQF